MWKLVVIEIFFVFMNLKTKILINVFPNLTDLFQNENEGFGIEKLELVKACNKNDGTSQLKIIQLLNINIIVHSLKTFLESKYR